MHVRGRRGVILQRAWQESDRTADNENYRAATRGIEDAVMGLVNRVGQGDTLWLGK